jgi:hypothetical protein
MIDLKTVTAFPVKHRATCPHCNTEFEINNDDFDYDGHPPYTAHTCDDETCKKSFYVDMSI